MTGLKSLFQKFRQSRSTRKARRAEGSSAPQATESLEQRLLLVNPDAFDSNLGAPRTVYLDFDGHTETDAAWTGRVNQHSLTRPAFDMTGNTGNFDLAERQTIEEIFLRVAEDFAPFSDINVTTVAPPQFNVGDSILVSIGGGSTAPGRQRNVALQNGFTDAAQSNTVFVFPRDYSSHPSRATGTLPAVTGEHGRDVANGISEAVLIAMGIPETSRAETVELTALVDNNAVESFGWRDTLSNQGGTDDIDILVNGNAGLQPRPDDHGDTQATATSRPSNAFTSEDGFIGIGGDVDVFHFSSVATSATFNVTGLDLTEMLTFANNPFTNLGLSNAGTNLDPTLTLYDANGNLLATDNPAFGTTNANDTLEAGFSVDLLGGDYYLEVSGGGQYGNVGAYTIDISGITTPTEIPSIIQQNNPGSDQTIYLDFNGGRVTEGEVIGERADGIDQPFYVPPYDSDGDLTSFSAQELLEIEEIYARVAEDFLPFDINVTTIDPFTYGYREGIQVLIGGDGSWINPARVQFGQNGFSSFGTFGADPLDENMAIAFTDSLADGKERALEISSTIQTAFGVETPLDFDGNGNATGRLPGFDGIGAIGGDSASSLRDIFSVTDGASQGSLQDPLSLIASTTNRIQFRSDDHGGSPAQASTINLVPGRETVRGIIERNGDSDFFAFETRGSDGAVITIKGLDLTVDDFGNPVAGITNPGANFDPIIELLNENGQRLVIDGEFPDPEDPTDGNIASLQAQIGLPLPQGRYFLAVHSQVVPANQRFGNVGEYTITIDGVDGTDVSLSFDDSITVREDQGVVANVGRLTRPTGQSTAAPIVVNLLSTDPTELVVPPIVTIPAGQSFVEFDVTAVDDTLLDGEQRVLVEAWIGGVGTGILNSTDIVRVADHETVSLSLDPSEIREDAGSGAVSLTVRRSNTDTGPDNHWVAIGDELREYGPDKNDTDTDGDRDEIVLISTLPIEWPVGVRPQIETARDVIVLEDGQIAVLNGTGNSFVSLYNPNSQTWQHFRDPGLSASPNDSKVGGLATVGDYVFVTDSEDFVDDPRGVLRINVVTGEVRRFADNSVGSRLFGSFVTGIHEIDPATGETLNVLQDQVNDFTEDLAFDGQFVWQLVDDSVGTGPVTAYKLSPDTGEILEVHTIPGLFSSGLAMTMMNGIMYITNSFGFFTFDSLIAYNPATRQIVTDQIPIGSINQINFASVMGSIPTRNLLVMADSGLFGTFGTSSIVLLNPTTGRVVSSFGVSSTNTVTGLTGMSDVLIGGVVYDEVIYVRTSANEIRVYDLNGNQVDMNPSTNPPDDLNLGRFVTEIGGGDVPNVSSADLAIRDVAIGLGDSLVYGLDVSGTRVVVYEAETLARVREIDLDSVVNAIAIDLDGRIIGGGGNGVITIFDSDGATISSISPVFTDLNIGQVTLGDIADVDTNVSREILVSGNTGVVAKGPLAGLLAGDTAGFTMLENVGSTSHISFGRNDNLPSGTLFVDLSSGDTSELSVPVVVEIPAGQQSVTIPIDIVDDNMLDGAQDFQVTGTSDNYVSVPLDVTVLDAEAVGVDILEDAVLETDGTIVDGVRVFRTDVDGPFDVPDRSVESMSDAVVINDNDVVFVPLVIREQESIITDVDVTLSLEHSFVPDLDVFLVSPNGTRVELFTDLSSNESSMTNTIFDDESPTRIVDGDAPYTGRFVPEQLLSTFDGEDPSGTWYLEVVDDNVTDSGILTGFTLDIRTLGLSQTEVTLVTSDATEAVVTTTTVIIPPATASVFIDLDALDDSIVDGTQPTTISVNTLNLAGFDLGSDTVDVLDVENLSITIADSEIRENAGIDATTATITRTDSLLDSPLVVSLVSNDATELSVPATVTIPAGQPSFTFAVGAVDDLDFDGDQPVTFSATAPGYIAQESPVVTVIDQEPRLVLSTLSQDIAEDGGTATIALSRIDATDLSVPLLVSLGSSDETELTVPRTVLIPLGAVSTTFTATIHEDDEVDGPQTVTIFAADADTANPLISGGTLDVVVADAEALVLSVDGASSLSELTGNSLTVTVSLTAPNPNPASATIVNLFSGDLTELNVPAQVVIPAGETSADFVVTSVDDTVIDFTQATQITAQSGGYLDGSLTVDVLDHEPPVPVGPGFETLEARPAITWAPVDGATRYDLWVNDISRNIVQLYREENTLAAAPIFADNFENNEISTTDWAYSGATLDGAALNPQSGVNSVRLNGTPDGGDILETRNINLDEEAGVQLKYSWQRTGGGDAPEASDDLIVYYRDASGAWVVLNRHAGDGPSMNVFNTAVIQLPEAALHANGGIRFQTIGIAETDDVDDPGDDWFIDDIELAANVQFTPPQNLGVGRYRFWTRAYNSLEQPGLWSAGTDFVVRTAPEIVSPVVSGNDAQSNAPVLQWTTVVNSSYDLWVNNLTTGESQVIRQQNLETTSFATTAANLGGGTYRAWVRAQAPDGVSGRWSSPVTFSILNAPAGLQPTGSTFDRTPELSWNSVPGAEYYFVWLAQRNPGQQQTVVLTDRFVEGTTRLPEQDLEFGRYVFWVQAVGGDGSRSQWSQPAVFSVGGRPQVISPSEDSTVGSQPTITWAGISQASHYEVWINRIDVPVNQAVYNDSVAATSFTVPNQLVAGEYRVWIRAVSEMGENSFWSLPVDFTVAQVEADDSGNDSMLASVSVNVLDLQTTLVVSPIEEHEPIDAKEFIATQQPTTAERENAQPAKTPKAATQTETDVEVALDMLMAGTQLDWADAVSEGEKTVVR